MCFYHWALLQRDCVAFRKMREISVSQDSNNLPSNDPLADSDFQDFDINSWTVPLDGTAPSNTENSADAAIDLSDLPPAKPQAEEVPGEELDDAAFPAAAQPASTEGKKRKKSKKESSSLPALLAMLASATVVAVLILFNLYCLLFNPFSAVGLKTILLYLLFVDVFGILIAAIPFLLMRIPHLNLFQSLLGVSVICMSVGVILLFTCLVRYDLTLHPPAMPAKLSLPVAPPEPPAE